MSLLLACFHLWQENKEKNIQTRLPFSLESVDSEWSASYCRYRLCNLWKHLLNLQLTNIPGHQQAVFLKNICNLDLRNQEFIVSLRLGYRQMQVWLLFCKCCYLSKHFRRKSQENSNDPWVPHSFRDQRLLCRSCS